MTGHTEIIHLLCLHHHSLPLRDLRLTSLDTLSTCSIIPEETEDTEISYLGRSTP